MNTAVGLTNVFVYFKRVGGLETHSPTRPEAHCYYRMATPGGGGKCVYRATEMKERALGIVKKCKRAFFALTFSLKHHASFSYLLYVLLDAESQERLHHA